jgi:hypothetical protein
LFCAAPGRACQPRNGQSVRRATNDAGS